MGHVDYLVKRVAQPIADWMHDRFGLTCYRLAAQCPLLALLTLVVRNLMLGVSLDVWMLLLGYLCLSTAHRFHKMDVEAARRDYAVKPATIVSAAINVLIWEVIASIDLALVFVPPMRWSDLSSTLIDLCFWFGWLLAMCDVKPRRRARQRTPAMLGAGAAS